MESIWKLSNFHWTKTFYQSILTHTLEKCEKECNMLENILVQGFCPLKIKITQFPDGFCLKLHVKFSGK